MKNKYPICANCKHVKKVFFWMACTHPRVVKNDATALVSGNGITAVYERSRRAPWAPCGRAGKLWEQDSPPVVKISSSHK